MHSAYTRSFHSTCIVPIPAPSTKCKLLMPHSQVTLHVHNAYIPSASTKLGDTDVYRHKTEPICSQRPDIVWCILTRRCRRDMSCAMHAFSVYLLSTLSRVSNWIQRLYYTHTHTHTHTHTRTHAHCHTHKHAVAADYLVNV